MKTLLLTLLFLGSNLATQAETRLPSLFCDHMVLQQKTSNAIWGFSDAGENSIKHLGKYLLKILISDSRILG